MTYASSPTLLQPVLICFVTDHKVSSYYNPDKTALTLSFYVSSNILTAAVRAKELSFPESLNSKIAAAPGISLLRACAKHASPSLAVEG